MARYTRREDAVKWLSGTLKKHFPALGPSFAVLAGHTAIRPTFGGADPDTFKAIKELNMAGSGLRGKLGLPIDDDTQSAHWRDVVGTGHVLLRGALDSLDRIARGEHQSDLENPSTGTIKFALSGKFFKKPDQYQVEGIEELAGIAQKIIAAEGGGVRDVKEVVSVEELQILMAGLNRFEISLTGLIDNQKQDRIQLEKEAHSLSAKYDMRKTGLSALTRRIFNPTQMEEDITTRTAIEQKLKIPNDIELYAGHLTKARGYYATLTADLARQINPYFPFDAATANPDPNIMATGSAALFGMTIGDALEAAGILTKAQVDESGNVQALAIAIRHKVETGGLDPHAVIKEIGKDGKVDLFDLAKKSQAERDTIKKNLGISDSELSSARAVVEKARAEKSNVNSRHKIPVPPMGTVHERLHGPNIRNFTVIKNAILMMQRGLDSVNAMRRMHEGVLNADASGKRGFRIWQNDPQELQDAVKTAEHIHDQEKLLEDGKKPVFAAHIDRDLAEIFDNAERFLRHAGQKKLAGLVADIRPKLLGEAFPSLDAGTLSHS